MMVDSDGSSRCRFIAPLMAWRTDSHGAIGYVVVDGDAAEKIRAFELGRRLESGLRRGFGSVRVKARIGNTSWATSVFPQKGGTWFLPVKQAICRAEGLDTDDQLEIRLDLL